LEDLDLLHVDQEVFEKFEEIKALVENQKGKKIKVLGLDKGGECTSKEFDTFWREIGIERELTVPYNPQQNGVVKRKNMSIIVIEGQGFMT
jgi:hypothetical protein